MHAKSVGYLRRSQQNSAYCNPGCKVHKYNKESHLNWGDDKMWSLPGYFLGADYRVKNTSETFSLKNQEEWTLLPVRSEGTRYFLLSRSGTLAFGAFSTIT